MADWNNAELNQEQTASNGIEITTDDLVFMLGEKLINERQKDKIIRWKDQQLQVLLQQGQELQQRLAIAESKLLSTESMSTETNNRMSTEMQMKDQQIEGLTKQVETARQSMHQRIVDLEEELFKTAQERDALKKETTKLREEIVILQAIPPKPTKKKKVQGGETWDNQ